MTEPNVRIGRNRLDMYQDRAILIPAIVAYFSATRPSDNIHTLQNFVREGSNRNSDNPPRREQVMINTDPINVPNMRDYFVETDLFTLSVPTIPPARSTPQYVEYPADDGRLAYCRKRLFLYPDIRRTRDLYCSVACEREKVLGWKGLPCRYVLRDSGSRKNNPS